MKIFYRHNRDISRFLSSNNSVSRSNYFRVLALSSIDILFTFPINAVNIGLEISWYVRGQANIPFYGGWVFTHTRWEPVGTSIETLRAFPGEVPQEYYSYWSCTVLAFITFGLFGLTAEARALYGRIFYSIARSFGWERTMHRNQHTRSTLGSIRFGIRSPRLTQIDTEAQYATISCVQSRV